MFLFLAHFGGPSKYAKRASFPALVMRVVVFLEDGEDGRSAGTLSCGDDGYADMTAQDGCFY
jgi:hypothetical protein